MTKVSTLAALALAPAALLSSASAQQLADFGSFHVGGRQVSLSGYPVTESVFTVWTRQQPASRKFADDVKARGGDVEFVELPRIGIAGNSHMLMMDTNSDQIADFIQAWMKRKSLMN